MNEKVIRCQDCCGNFVFTAKQQERYAERGWPDPIRCPNCRARKKEIWQINEVYRKYSEGGLTWLKSRGGREFIKKYVR